MARWQITNASIVLDGKIKKSSTIVIEDQTIEDIIAGEKEELLKVNLHGQTVIPALINSHDSLLATYDAIRNEWPYLNWLAHDNEVKSSVIFKERMLIEVEDLYRLGAYKNLIHGATFVVDHIPHFVRKPFEKIIPVSLLEDYGIGHSICSYSLKWGEGIKKEHEYAKSRNLPFIVHIAEGFDPESKESLSILDDMGCLDEYTVLVHGLSLSNRDLDLIEKRNASIVICPSANLFLYKKTSPVVEILKRNIVLSVGTDSSMCGSAGIIQEIKCLKKILNDESCTVSDYDLLEMVTANPAKVFRLEQRGKIEKNSLADFFVLKHTESFFDELWESGPESISLLVRGGEPFYADIEYEALFKELDAEYETINIKGCEKIIKPGLKKVMKSIEESVGYKKKFTFLPVEE